MLPRLNAPPFETMFIHSIIPSLIIPFAWSRSTAGGERVHEQAKWLGAATRPKKNLQDLERFCQHCQCSVFQTPYCQGMRPSLVDVDRNMWLEMTVFLFTLHAAIGAPLCHSSTAGRSKRHRQGKVTQYLGQLRCEFCVISSGFSAFA